MSAAAMPSEIVRFEFNVPQLVAMKFAAPKILGTKMGERAMFSLSDGRIMFTPPSVAGTAESMGTRKTMNLANQR
jgi:hypothetical protein